MAICLFCIVSLLLYWQIFISVIAVFSIRGIKRYLDSHVPHMARLLFAIAETYAGLEINRESNIKGPIPSPVMVISNHQSLVDIPILLSCFPHNSLRFVAKKELKKGVPAVSPTLRFQRHALINRKAQFHKTLEELKKLGRRSKYKTSPVIFPEGTRSRTGKVKSFHTGAFRRVFLENPIPIVSVALNGGYRFSDVKSILRNLKNGRYDTKILSIYDPPKNKEEISSVLESCHKEIKAQVEHWQGIERKALRREGISV